MVRDAARGIGARHRNPFRSDLDLRLRRTAGCCEKTVLCAKCIACPVVDVCGGGSVPHRFGPDGFNHPTVYCEEFLALITHAKTRAEQLISTARLPLVTADQRLTSPKFELAEEGSVIVDSLWDCASNANQGDFAEALRVVSGSGLPSQIAQDIESLTADQLHLLANRPDTIAWGECSKKQGSWSSICSVDGLPLEAGGAYLATAIDRVRQRERFEVGAEGRMGAETIRQCDCVRARGMLSGTAIPLVHEALEIVHTLATCFGEGAAKNLPECAIRTRSIGAS